MFAEPGRAHLLASLCCSGPARAMQAVIHPAASLPTEPLVFFFFVGCGSGGGRWCGACESAAIASPPLSCEFPSSLLRLGSVPRDAAAAGFSQVLPLLPSSAASPFQLSAASLSGFVF